MNYIDFAMLNALSLLTISAMDLSRRSGTNAEQGNKNRATLLLFAAGFLQVATVFLAIHVGFRLFSI
ncbi:hypothetical protein [Sulfitobacter alexandrii]|uniref:hypothetical protein n=1 Tax=Sulfitobacter alexandrii TaxID=1917485 RepID=UPI0012EB98DD|nr:hypothetical protein [Sulfitobacter alexandrii]